MTRRPSITFRLAALFAAAAAAVLAGAAALVLAPGVRLDRPHRRLVDLGQAVMIR